MIDNVCRCIYHIRLTLDHGLSVYRITTYILGHKEHLLGADVWEAQIGC